MDDGVAAMLRTLNDSFPRVERMSAGEARAAVAARRQPTSNVEDAASEDRAVDTADGVAIPVRIYRPRGTGEALSPGVVFLHGGGFVLCDIESHDGFCRAMSRHTGAVVVSVGYRLAPEHPFPAALDDAVAATCWAHANAATLGCSADRLAVGGDSAGANLAIVVCHLHPVPLRYQLLVYPATDLTRRFPSHIENAAGPSLTTQAMDWFIRHYAGGYDTLADSRLSPHFAADDVVAASPPTLVITAEYDPLRDEGDAYAARLASLGVPTSHVRFSGMYHGFFGMADFLDDALAANNLAGVALGRALSR